MIKLSSASIVKSLESYGFRPKEYQCEQIRTYIDLLGRWNRQISLTRVTEPIEILRFHFGESLCAMSTMIVATGRLADVGSGAGFPGMPLAIANSQLNAVLIEPNLKKSVFLSEVKRELKLDNVEVFRGRMEEYRSGALDYVASRAVGQFEGFLKFAHKFLAPNGKVVLWIGFEDSQQIVKQHPEWTWGAPRLIPKSERRFILSGSRPPQ